jgi:hypothetical protein
MRRRGRSPALSESWIRVDPSRSESRTTVFRRRGRVQHHRVPQARPCPANPLLSARAGAPLGPVAPSRGCGPRAPAQPSGTATAGTRTAREDLLLLLLARAGQQEHLPPCSARRPSRPSAGREDPPPRPRRGCASAESDGPLVRRDRYRSSGGTPAGASIVRARPGPPRAGLARPVDLSHSGRQHPRQGRKPPRTGARAVSGRPRGRKPPAQ